VEAGRWSKRKEILEARVALSRNCLKRKAGEGAGSQESLFGVLSSGCPYADILNGGDKITVLLVGWSCDTWTEGLDEMLLRERQAKRIERVYSL